MVGTIAGSSMPQIDFTSFLLYVGGPSLTILTTVVAYFLRGVMDQVKEQQKELNTLHEKYVKKDDFGTFKTELWNRFDRLEDQLAKKPDTK